MAMQYIRSFSVYDSNGDWQGMYVVRYDPETGQAEKIWQSSNPEPPSVTAEQVGIPTGTVITSFCYGEDKHTLTSTHESPFISINIEDSAAECMAILNPPDPEPPPPPPVILNYICYQLQVLNTENQLCVVNIYDEETNTGTTIEYRQLTGSGAPINLLCVDQNEDVFTIIKAKQLQVAFLSTPEVNLNTFLDGYDGKWRVEHYINTDLNPVFHGWLSLADMQEDFLSEPNVVSLIATDNLGILKEEKLTRPDGTALIQEGLDKKYRFIELVSYCLRKTNLELPINLIFNLKPHQEHDQTPLDTVYIDAKTFEDEIGTSVDCYRALEIMLKGCFLTQFKGEWWIVRIAELKDLIVRHKFDYQGTYEITFPPSNELRKTLINTVDNTSIQFINASTSIRGDRRHKHVKETFNYTYPKEIVDNIDFSRGNGPLPISLEEGATAYAIHEWTLGSEIDVVTTTAYIKRVFVEGYENERYAVIESDPNGSHFIRSVRIPVTEKDKFTLSVDRRLSGNLSGSGFLRTIIARVHLTGDDGNFYTLHGGTSVEPDPVWVLSDSDFDLNAKSVWLETDLSQNETDWKNTSVDAAPIPVDGFIEILLFQTANEHDDKETHFQNLQFNYNPYINGSYQQFSGHYWQVSQDVQDKAIREEDYHVDDAPRELFKGAMFLKNEFDEYYLTSGWFDARATTFPAAEDIHPYGWWLTFDIFNQYKRVMRIFNASLLGLNTDGEMPDLVHRYTIGEETPHSTNREFMCLHFSQNERRCDWSAYLIEFKKSDEPDTYDETVTFKYVEQR
jgi:hypothetical protein